MADLEDVQILAEELIAEHLDHKWVFAFDHAKRRSGACHYGPRRITLSKYVAAVATLLDMHQVMLHEIAHAKAGARAGHGVKWRKIASDLGYDGRRLDATAVDEQFAPYIGTCPRGHIIYRYQQPRKAMSCGVCSSKFDSRYLVDFRKRSQRVL